MQIFRLEKLRQKWQISGNQPPQNGNRHLRRKQNERTLRRITNNPNNSIERHPQFQKQNQQTATARQMRRSLGRTPKLLPKTGDASHVQRAIR